MQYQSSLEFAKAQDQKDPLRTYRDRFHFPSLGTAELAYFTGHSLGLQPKSVRAAVSLELDEWAKYGVEGHFHSTNPWYSYHERLTPAMAEIVGAKDSEVVCMNSLTTNIHLLFVSFYRPTASRYKIISEAKMFPSDRYMLETQVRFHGFDPDDAIIEVPPRAGESLIREEDILAAIESNADELAMVFFGGVNYLTGQLFDMQSLTKAAHAVGAIAGFDLAHAAGNVLLSLHEWDVDFAAWCSYKYLNSSPGNVGAIFVHERHGRNFDLPRFGGWWGHDKTTRFQMKNDFQPMEGADGWQLSNAPILGMSAAKASLDVFAEVGMAALRKKSEMLTGYLEYTVGLLADEFPDAEISVITPRDPDQRGCQLSIDIAGRERQLFDDMIAAGVIADFREPCIIRVAPVPLYNSFEDVFTFGKIMRKLLPK
ncbi:kynureninase [Woeseia oceani]|uniref:Kynureninase n=1 Tax=Woeseia oceani TaxID=1548547 RepID=A0A193LDT4_9GAMM|nr:kynureninase [Woeseia oceani]ANO50544.1 kynureninase [Woeseia oceani]